MILADIKYSLADEVLEALDKRYGNVRSNVDMIDVSTPSTVEPHGQEPVAPAVRRNPPKLQSSFAKASEDTRIPPRPGGHGFLRRRVIRFTNNWKGSFKGWVLSPKIGFKSIKKTLPRLRDFYMTGQWVEPGGGLPTAILSGRNVCQIICREDKKIFRTSK